MFLVAKFEATNVPRDICLFFGFFLIFFVFGAFFGLFFAYICLFFSFTSNVPRNLPIFQNVPYQHADEKHYFSKLCMYRVWMCPVFCYVSIVANWLDWLQDNRGFAGAQCLYNKKTGVTRLYTQNSELLFIIILL